MVIETINFGEIEVEEEQIITFPDGIPGFDGLRRYILIENPDKEVPFHWLQSVEDGELAFVIINPFIFKKDYDFELPPHIVEKLQIESHEDLVVYAIVVIPEDMNQMTANLAAPIVINQRAKIGKQVLLEDDRYSRRHLILEELKKSLAGNSQEGHPTAEEGL